jgi:hypothetical protein
MCVSLAVNFSLRDVVERCDFINLKITGPQTLNICWRYVRVLSWWQSNKLISMWSKTLCASLCRDVLTWTMLSCCRNLISSSHYKKATEKYLSGHVYQSAEFRRHPIVVARGLVYAHGCALLVIFRVYDAKKNPSERTGYPENYWNPFFVSPKYGKRLG